MMTDGMIVGRFPSNLRRRRRIFLAFCYLAGLVAGVILAAQADSSFSSWMRTAVFQRVSIVSLLSVLFLPFLISAFAVFYGWSFLLYPICFLKSLSFGYCCAGISILFGAAGWLGCWLLLFSQLLAMPILLFYWMRHIDGLQKPLLSEAALLASILYLVGSLDHCLISPFLVKVIEF